MDENVGSGPGPEPSGDPGETTYLPRIKAPLRSTAPDATNDPHTDDHEADDLWPDDSWADDPWAWASAEEPLQVIDISDCRVTAVLVTQNAARWLPETLTALAGLTRRPDRVIAIDNESVDRTLDLLDDSIQRREIDSVYLGRHGFGFGDAIRSALRQDSTLKQDGPDENDWLWLLHDDAAPAPDALAQLLGHVVSDPTVDITGPKLLRPRRRHRPHQISEIGVSITSSGQRYLGLEDGEIDQGQRDQPARRLAVGSCGMLIRRSLWDELGGFDPAIAGYRDGVELGWRAQLAGHKIMTTPAATMVHRQVGRAGLRPSGVGGQRPDKLDREYGMALIAAHAGGAALVWTWLRLLFGCLVRALGYLIGKVPRRSVDELAAGWSFLIHPGRIRRMRHRLHAGRIDPRSEAIIARLRPGRFLGVRTVVEMLSAAIGSRYTEIAGAEATGTSLDELTSDELPSTPEEKRTSPWASPIIITMLASIVVCLIAARKLIGLGSLTSPYLLPVSTDLGGLWQTFRNAIPGAPATTTAPWTGLVAAAGTIFFGRPEWLISVLVIGTVPLAMLTSYPLIRRVVDERRVRLWTAVSYALLPVLLGGTNQGRLLLSVAAILLPLLVIAGRSLVMRRPGNPEAGRGGWGAGLVLTVLGAFAPALIGLAAILAVIAGCTIVRGRRKVGRLVIAIATPLVILSPWWPTVIKTWGRLLTGPDPALQTTATTASPLYLLIGHTGGAGLPPIWLGAIAFGAIWSVAVLGLLRGSRRRAVIVGWLVGVLALAFAVGLSRLLVRVPPLDTPTRPDIGIYLLIAFGALVLAGGIGVDGYTAELGARSFSVAQPLSVLAAVGAALICLLGAGWWVTSGATGPVHRTRLTAIPPYVADAQTGPYRVRTLAIDLRGGRADYSVVQDDQDRLGDAERGYAFGGSRAARAEVSDVVARLVSGSGDADLAGDLADLGVNYVWVGGADDDVRTRITNTPGLATASGSAAGDVWQLSQPTSRVRLVSGEQVTRLADPIGAADGVRIPASSLKRELRLGVPSDSRWVATLNDKPLRSAGDANADDSWQQTFQLPQTGGVLRVELRSPIPWLPIGQGVALLITMVLAAPAIRRPDVRDPVRDARRVATTGSGGRVPQRGPGAEDWSELTSVTGLFTVSGGLTTSVGKDTGSGDLPVVGSAYQPAGPAAEDEEGRP